MATGRNRYKICQYMDSIHPEIPYRYVRGELFIDYEVVTTVDGVRDPIVFHGFLLKIKPAGTRLRHRDGGWASPQIAADYAQLDELVDRGYIAQFACGESEAEDLVDSYLGGIR